MKQLILFTFVLALAVTLLAPLAWQPPPREGCYYVWVGGDERGLRLVCAPPPEAPPAYLRKLARLQPVPRMLPRVG